MKIRILSDLHLEFRDWTPPPAEADVFVLAGDIHVGTDGVAWGRKRFPHTAIIYVPGNHEFYDSEMESCLRELRRVAKTLNINLLDSDAVVIGGVRFFGATLSTDFALYGSEPAAVARSISIAARGMTDYRLIRWRKTGLLTPEDTLNIHQSQVAWLSGQLAQPFAGDTVVVTHHLPHPNSVHPRYAGDALNPSFASDLSALVREPVKLWIHGHTHESMDHVVAGTRVVCNPRGYLPREPNWNFQADLVVELG